MILALLRIRSGGKARRPVAVPPLAILTPDTRRVQLCLSSAVVLVLVEHLRFWADVTTGSASIEDGEVGLRYQAALERWAAELLISRAALWAAPRVLNRLMLPVSQAAMLYETLRHEDPISALAPLRDRLHKLLV